MDSTNGQNVIIAPPTLSYDPTDIRGGADLDALEKTGQNLRRDRRTVGGETTDGWTALLRDHPEDLAEFSPATAALVIKIAITIRGHASH